MRWQNFSIWYGRLPHWRADDVTYYVTFRHRRPLTDEECRRLLSCLVKPDAKKWDLLVACVLPEQTELMFKTREGHELSDVVEKAKNRASKEIIKKSGERFGPFYHESYDRIVRDEAELEERWQAIVDSPVNAELAEDPEEYECLWVANRP